MKPNAPIAWRPVLAAGVILAVLAGAYEAARRLPLPTLAARATAATPAPAGPVAAPEPVAVPVPAKPAPTTPTPEAAEPAPPECRPQPLRFTERRRTALALGPGSPRRYVGTVGGEPVTAEIGQERPGVVSGRVYSWRTSQEYGVSQPARHRPRLLKISGPDAYRSGGWWHLTQRPGTVLRGTWVDSAGRQPRPLELRESYQGGVRYEIWQLTLTGGPPASRNSCDVPQCSRDFLRLLGPAADRPPLGHLQWPAPAGRRRLVRADYSSDLHAERGIEVLLNDFNLLSYHVYIDDMPFGGSSSSIRASALVDLTTGRQLAFYDQLQAGYELPLRRLLTRHARQDFGYQPEPRDSYNGWEWVNDHGRQVQLAPLPNENPPDVQEGGDKCVLTVQGLAVRYNQPFINLLIPYAELRPLVRPGTPLARMLRARGLW
ncbi:MAG: hypothetical protein ACRYFX_00355 [Janthinobacterium lividum]